MKYVFNKTKETEQIISNALSICDGDVFAAYQYIKDTDEKTAKIDYELIKQNAISRGALLSEDELTDAFLNSAVLFEVAKGKVKPELNFDYLKSKDYLPIPLYDTAGIQGDDWLQWRKIGIGGSDCGCIFNVSKFKNVLDVYYDKTEKNIKTSYLDEDGDKEGWFTLDFGHAVEPIIRKLFSVKTGYETVEDTIMYRHPIFPFITANIDGKVYTDENDKTRFAIFEAKTTLSFNKEKWTDGNVPITYLYQIRQYMAVMNVDVAYISCLYDNNEDSFIYYKVVRDIQIEKYIIQGLYEFWYNNVIPKIQPVYNSSIDSLSKTARKYEVFINKREEDLDNALKLGNSSQKILENYFELEEKIKNKKRELKEAEELLDNCKLPFINTMLKYDNDACLCEKDGAQILITYKPFSRESINKTLLQEKYPNIYNEVVKRKTEAGRKFNIKKIKRIN